MGLVSLYKGPVDTSLLRPDTKKRPASFITKNPLVGVPITNNNNNKTAVVPNSNSSSPPSSPPPTASTSSSGSTSPTTPDRKSLEQRSLSVMQ